MTLAKLVLFDGDRSTEVACTLTGGVVTLSHEAVLAATGWEVKPHGLCRGDVCNPADLGPQVELGALAVALRRPLAVQVLDGRAVAMLGAAGGSTLQVGDLAPAVSLPDVDGNPVAVTGAGRKTAVVTWSTWCGCRYELPAWLELAHELAGDGLDIVTVALDEDAEAVRKWSSRAGDLPVAVDSEHRMSDLFGIVNVPSVVWLDEQRRVVKPPTIAPGDDQFVEFTEVRADAHHDALRAWARGGAAPEAVTVNDAAEVRAARTERRLAAWLSRHGYADEAETHFAEAVRQAPLDFSIRRASMPLRGQDPFGAEFFELWQEWSSAGRPGYAPTAAPRSGSAEVLPAADRTQA